ncbi:hypothetical protein DGMP_06400 [Desulfomarina profundi]|uniref:Uncharacterized protein n=1 Tax=Desulfomarina profundi TaxID=2772557 RepID=A0A8D5JKW7_9BACT|nr:hypothetical protein [Desulfomarina profundi]BCL59947.1 hypothetical protein DGMP_06400 [Desulfomarina profundi]
MDEKLKKLIKEATAEISDQLQKIGFGNAYNPNGIGAIEGLTIEIKDATSSITASLDGISSAIQELKQSIEESNQTD